MGIGRYNPTESEVDHFKDVLQFIVIKRNRIHTPISEKDFLYPIILPKYRIWNGL